MHIVTILHLTSYVVGLLYKMVTMVPPPKLRAAGVDVCHLVQRPGREYMMIT